jgi:hypothetical protein
MRAFGVIPKLSITVQCIPPREDTIVLVCTILGAVVMRFSLVADARMIMLAWLL